MRLAVFDVFQQLAPRTYDPALPVRIIDIDEETLARHGQWPWPRKILADLTSRAHAAGAVTIGFDMVFPEVERTSIAELLARLPEDTTLKQISAAKADTLSGDADFAAALSVSKSILGFVGTDRADLSRVASQVAIAAPSASSQFVLSFPGMIHSHLGLHRPAISAAALNWVPEHDQIVRRLPLVVRIGDALYPSFIAEAVRLGQGATDMRVVSEKSDGAIASVRTGNIVAPTDERGQLLLRFTPTDPRRFVPAWKLLAGDPDAVREVADRIVLVGTSAAGLFDLRTTPLDASVPGVEVHAQAIEQLVSGAYLHRPDFSLGLEVVFMNLAGLLLAFVLSRSGALLTGLIGCAAIALAFAASWLVFSRGGWLLDPVYPAATLLLIYLATTARQFFFVERERNQIRNAFVRYMAPAFVEELARDPSKLKLGGEMRTLTLMFCDIRGFTSFAEKLDAAEVTRFLNHLLTPLSGAILDNKGTIDKYLGDGIMAFWNAPLDDPEHAAHAARAALQMLTALKTFNDELASSDAHGIDPAHLPVRIGIGLNTALCCVGNLGSETRFDYSVIGDGVNTAARIESETKSYGAAILAGPETVALCPDLAWLQVDHVMVKGRTSEITLFALMGDADHRASAAFEAQKRKHADVISAIDAGDGARALAALNAVRAMMGRDSTALYERFEERIRTRLAVSPREAVTRPQ